MREPSKDAVEMAWYDLDAWATFDDDRVRRVVAQALALVPGHQAERVIGKVRFIGAWQPAYYPAEELAGYALVVLGDEADEDSVLICLHELAHHVLGHRTRWPRVDESNEQLHTRVDQEEAAAWALACEWASPLSEAEIRRVAALNETKR